MKHVLSGIHQIHVQLYTSEYLKPTWSDVGNTLAPSVSGSLWAKPGCCGCPAWQIVVRLSVLS